MIEKSFRLDRWDYFDIGIENCPVPISTNYPITKAIQTRPGTRAARRQAKREQSRKWKIKYAGDEEG